MSENYSFRIEYNDDGIPKLTKTDETHDFISKYKSGTEKEKSINIDVADSLKKQIKKKYDSDRTKYRSIKRVCIELASLILDCPVDSDEAKKLGENIYKASNKKTSITYANVVEIEQNSDIHLADEKITSYPSLRLLKEVYEHQKSIGRSTHKLSRFLNKLAKKLEEKQDGLESDFEDLINNLSKHLE